MIAQGKIFFLIFESRLLNSNSDRQTKRQKTDQSSTKIEEKAAMDEVRSDLPASTLNG